MVLTFVSKQCVMSIENRYRQVYCAQTRSNILEPQIDMPYLYLLEKRGR